MDRSVPIKLLNELSKAADVVRGHNFIHIFSHYDADGLSSAAIIAKTLIREGKEFCVTLLTSLDDTTFQEIENSGAECIIITDLGASYIKELDELESDVIVLDHHTVDAKAKNICYMNPHLYGIDGMSFGCGATMACLFAIEMDENDISADDDLVMYTEKNIKYYEPLQPQLDLQLKKVIYDFYPSARYFFVQDNRYSDYGYDD